MSTDRQSNRLMIGLALLSVYVIWGSTYLGIELALNGGFPPMLLGGIRFIAAGLILLAVTLARSYKLPTPRQWCNGAFIGVLLLIGGNGGVMLAEHWEVASGLAAVVVAGVGIWVALFSLAFGHAPARLEWLGLFVGLGGVALLTFRGDLSANPLGAAVIIGGTMCWALGTVVSKRLDMPQGLMSSVVQMLAAGVGFSLLGALTGERISQLPTIEGIGAMLYLIFFGSLLGYTAFIYLVQNVKPVLATSYAYVNPIIATLLGVWWLKESVTLTSLVAMGIILAGVALIGAGRERAQPPAASEQPRAPQPVYVEAEQRVP